MKKNHITLFLALMLCSFAFAQNIDVIEPQLQNILNQRTEDLVDIQIHFKSNVSSEQLNKKTRKAVNKSEKKALVIDELKSHSIKVQSDVMEILKAEALNGEVSDISRLWITNSISCKASHDIIYKISSHPDIKAISYDKEIQLISPEQMQESTAQPMTLRGTAPHVVTVQADKVWEKGYTGRNVVVAVLDSGTTYKHKDLADHLWTGYVDTDGDGNPDKQVNGWNFISNNDDISDDFGHGTHCAGIVCGDGNSGTTTGVAPDASLMTVKTINRAGGGSVTQMLNGVQFAVENGADILSLSLGFKDEQITKEQKESIREAFDKVLEAGVIACVAAGNDGNTYGAPFNVDYPAACPSPWRHPDQTLEGGLSGVVCVGANDLTASSVGPSTWEGTSYNDYPYDNGASMGLIRPDISAPGKLIYSLNHLEEDKYKLMEGTSQSTPCVAGVIALMLEKNIELTPAEITQIIEETAAEKPSVKNNTVGSGRIDALAAVNEIAEEKSTPYISLLSFTPEKATIGNNSLILTVINEGHNSSAANTTVTLSLKDNPYVTISNPTKAVGSIEVNGTKTLQFDFYVDSQAPSSGHVAHFNVTTTSDDYSWTNALSVNVNSIPNVVFHSVNPGVIDINASSDVNITMINNGTADMTSPMTLTLSTITNDLKYIELVTNNITIEPIAVGETATATFNVKTNESTPVDYKFDLFLETFSESSTPSNYVYEFESDMEGWTCFDASNNNSKEPWWHSSGAKSHGLDSKNSHSGKGHLMSQTSNSGYLYNNPIDHYLVSPIKVKVTENSKMSFYARSNHNVYYREHFGVSVSTTGNTSANHFTQLDEWNITEKTNWKEYTVDLSDYAGQEIYVAIHHFFTEEEWNDPYLADQGYGVEALNIDDIFFTDIILDIHHVPTYSDNDPNWFRISANNIIDLPIVQNLEAIANSSSQITLTWDAVEGANSYNVYRNGKKITSTSATTFTDKNLADNTKYCYNVTATNGSGESGYSESAWVTTLKEEIYIDPEVTPVPAAPTVSASAVSASEITLSWNAVEGAIAYNVYQGATQLATGLTETTFTVKDLQADKEYCFNVTSVNETGESKHSDKACAKTLLGESITELSSLFNIYPNPVKDEIRIKAEARIEEITIYTVTGVAVYNERGEMNETTLNVSGLSGGVYFVEVRFEEGTSVKRIVKQ